MRNRVYVGFCVLVFTLSCEKYLRMFSTHAFGGIFKSKYRYKFSKEPINCSTPVDFFYGEAEQGEFPHQALLGYAILSNKNQIEFRCGGSLISRKFVLTAAHCRMPKIVRLGEYDLDDDDDEQRDFKVADFIQHPNYTSSQSYHDIALVKLAEKALFDIYVYPARLWTSLPFNMSSVIATGFGRTSNEYDDMSSKLIKLGLYILDSAECQHRYKFDSKLENGLLSEQMCVGSRGDGRDTCNGDSGGPIQVALDFGTCEYYVVGIISFGNPTCGAGNSEAVYTQVASYLDWIKKILRYDYSQKNSGLGDRLLHYLFDD